MFRGKRCESTLLDAKETKDETLQKPKQEFSFDLLQLRHENAFFNPFFFSFLLEIQILDLKAYYEMATNIKHYPNKMPNEDIRSKTEIEFRF